MNAACQNIRLCGFLLIWISYYSVFAQIEQPNRFELEQKYSDEDFTIIPLNQEGLALIRETNKYKSGNRTWEVILLDTMLHKRGTLEFEIDTQNSFIGFEYSVSQLHLLFNKNEIKGYMDLLSIDLDNQKDIKQYEIKSELNFQITHFSEVGGNFILGGFVNREPAVLLYSPSSDNLKVLPNFFQKDTELIDLRVNENETFNTLLIERGSHDSKKVIFRTFDSSGKQLLEDLTTIDDDIVLLTGICSSLKRDDLVIIGTYGKINSKQASGFYALPVNPFAENKVKKIYFGELEHFLDYLRPKRASVIKLKTSNALEHGKIPDFTNYVMPFKIIEHETGFLLLAETYNPSANISQYPYYPYNTYSYYSPYGGYYPNSRMYSPNPAYSYGNNVQNTDEVKSIESVILAFDGGGTLLWDFSLKLSEIKRRSLEQTSDFFFDGDTLSILYKKESELKTKSINIDTDEDIEQSTKIQLNNKQDEIRSEAKEGVIKHWFGNTFYVWGNQSIRNRSNAENKTREVFYINKVVFH